MQTTQSATDLDERLQSFVGQPIRGTGVQVAPDPVNEPMIRHWAAAFEDRNPVYVDPGRAAASRFGGIVAPPLMLQTWTMATPVITGMKERGGSPVELEESGVLSVLDKAGYFATLASDSEFEIARYLRPGDLVTSRTVVESVSEQKQTRRGPGYFITWLSTYTDQRDEVVGVQRFRIIKFAPQPPADAPTESASPRPPAPTGDPLPPLHLAVTATHVVAGALASRDFMPVHHDKAYANAQGSPDIFMNVLSITGLASRFLTDWAGPEAAVTRLQVRLGIPVLPGTELDLTGVHEGDGRVAYRGASGLGTHFTGTATLDLPR